MLELQRNVDLLRRWWWLLLAACLAGGIVAYTLTKILVQPQYQTTAVVSMAPSAAGPGGLWLTMLSSSADAQLVSTQRTARAALRLLPSASRRHINATQLAPHIVGTTSLEGQLLYVTVTWPDDSLVEPIANAVVEAFVTQERSRLQSHYQIIHASLLQQEAHLARLENSVTGSGAARSWLQAQYADTAARIYQEDADARIQVSTQKSSLDIAQPATISIRTGAKALFNAILGAGLGLLLALVAVFVASNYGQWDEPAFKPTLANVRDGN